MPKSNIEAAVKRATGRSADGDTQSVTYEGNLASVGFIIDTLTDKKTRTVANIKSIFKKSYVLMDRRLHLSCASIDYSSGGNVSPSAFLFDHLGLVVVAANEITLDSATNIAIESGAEDVELVDNEYLFWTSPGVLNEVAQGIKQSGCELLEARLQYRPKSLQIVSNELRAQVDGLVDTLLADEDVIRVTNTMQKRHQNE